MVSDGSATASTSFQLSVLGQPAPPSGLVITTNGSGMVTPNLNIQKLTMGKTYTVTAIPAAGQVFSGWSGSYNSTNSRLTFMMASNLALQANFIPSPFIPAVGSYSGLFYENDQVRLSRSGFFKVTTGRHGGYTGYVQIGTNRYPLSGGLDLQRRASKSIVRHHDSPLALSLIIGNTNDTDHIYGQLTSSNWTATLLADRAVFDIRTNPAPYKGKYTLIVSGQTSDASLPAGYGFGGLSVSPGGMASFAGKLADGTVVSRSAPLSKNGNWPLYVPLYAGNGSILSWMTFTNQAKDDISGALSWIKLPNAKARYYPNGFTNDCQAVGSAYVPPVHSNILDLTSARLEFSGGNLGSCFTNCLTLGLNSKVSSSSNHLTMSFTLANGAYHGNVTDPACGKSWPFSGVVLQKMNAGYGLLLGTDQSSAVTFVP